MDGESAKEENTVDNSISRSSGQHAHEPQGNRDNEFGSSPAIRRRGGRTRARTDSISSRRPTRNGRNIQNKRCRLEKTDGTILSRLIDVKMVYENQTVYYMDGTSKKEIKAGAIQRDGILCACCSKVFTVLEFERHAGGELHQPYKNIVTDESARSILSFMKEAWYRIEEAGIQKPEDIMPRRNAAAAANDDGYDDACIICADGGDLICCKLCSSTYHADCMKVKPEGDLLCPYCVCKFCAKPCEDNDYLISCFQCERSYHWECSQEKNPEPINLNSPSTPFCDQNCKEVYRKLEKMLGVKHELSEGFSWTLLRRMDPEFGVSLSDSYQIIECHSKLTIAKHLIEECFDPIIDRYTQINTVHNVVYNCKSTYNRVNFRGFYTVILEKGDEVITAATLRIHGTKFAEMPFIGTHEKQRGKGMCRRLMAIIESALSYLKVESLVIPSSKEKVKSWESSYGFQPISHSMESDLRAWNALMFHDSIRLQKVLPISQGGEDEQAENKEHGLPDLNLEAPPSD